jgi:hypothetical protein
MAEYLSGRKELISTLIEDLLYYAGIIKIRKNGKLSKDGTEELMIARNTREYQIYLGGKRTNASICFVYDNRDNLADVQMSFIDYAILKKELLSRGINNERVQIPESRKDIEFRSANGEVENWTGRKKQGGVLDGLRKLKGQQ